MTEKDHLIAALDARYFTGLHFDGRAVVGYTCLSNKHFWQDLPDICYGFDFYQVRYNKAVGKGTKHKCSFVLA